MEDLIMLNKSENLPEGLVACEVCLKEIPRSVGRSQDGSDYVLYFCGDNLQEGRRPAEAGKPDTGWEVNPYSPDVG
jgi:hypothetical protein